MEWVECLPLRNCHTLAGGSHGGIVSEHRHQFDELDVSKVHTSDFSILPSQNQHWQLLMSRWEQSKLHVNLRTKGSSAGKNLDDPSGLPILASNPPDPVHSRHRAFDPECANSVPRHRDSQDSLQQPVFDVSARWGDRGWIWSDRPTSGKDPLSKYLKETTIHSPLENKPASSLAGDNTVPSTESLQVDRVRLL